jgi:hypothetical protein
MTPADHVPVPAPGTPAKRTWWQRLASILLIIFCLELGLFLLIYPWTDSWAANYFAWIGPIKLQPYWHQLWNNPYVRGAISGLGLLNIWVAVAEALRMFIGEPEK